MTADRQISRHNSLARPADLLITLIGLEDQAASASCNPSVASVNGKSLFFWRQWQWSLPVALSSTRPSTRSPGTTKASSSFAVTQTELWPYGTWEAKASRSRQSHHTVRTWRHSHTHEHLGTLIVIKGCDVGWSLGDPKCIMGISPISLAWKDTEPSSRSSSTFCLHPWRLLLLDRISSSNNVWRLVNLVTA